VRKALMLLVVVALIIVALGAANSSIAFDFDMVFGTWSAVSLFWVAVAAAGVLVAVALAAVWLSGADASRTRRKVEAELQTTYERLRAAEARLPEEPEAAPEPHETPGPQDASEPQAGAEGPSAD
jgi:uncharacterized membrane protein YciS (DUF1049 family)